ncbi:TetR/AcrR family transcriptional regulator [Antrihabitans stalactiti]|uniref:TetR/AcrR family transcriptional regulator n=1 Tax=Antrihabitans stalactiti TaxID=2584121 RepID=A0A848K7J2_9NOCA|nr:TetR/AcrR family transcriptional regulator [Antrihabitans stalactiti]NMN94763.1 TetR/AcrR family transcriptional regulator [Antrihabitans stalactiti]
MTTDGDWENDPPPSMAQSSLLRDPPVTERGVRTKAALVKAARVVFERDGYLDARLTDITKEADCSTGTFYTYFASKEEVFAAVLEVAQEDMLHPGMGRVADTDDPYAVVEASNRAYFEAYQRNSRLMGLLEQVSSIDANFREVRRRRSSAFIKRNARSIADLQARGLADAQLDPLMASRALSSMISRLAFGAFVLDEGIDDGDRPSFDDLLFTASRIWANALRFPDRHLNLTPDSS